MSSGSHSHLLRIRDRQTVSPDMNLVNRHLPSGSIESPHTTSVRIAPVKILNAWFQGEGNLRREFLGAGPLPILIRDRLTKLFHLASPHIIVPVVGSKDMRQLVQHGSAGIAGRRSQPLGASEADPTKMLPLTLRLVHVVSMGPGTEA